MFHVLDHSDVVYSSGPSQSTEYVIEQYGKKLDEAIRTGIHILSTDPHRSLNEARQAGSASKPHEFWKPIEDWMID